MELQSLALYILVSFSREDINSSEAGVKYFVIGSLSTCIFLFGSSLIYGLVGSTDFSNIMMFNPLTFDINKREFALESVGYWTDKDYIAGQKNIF